MHTKNYQSFDKREKALSLRVEGSQIDINHNIERAGINQL